MTIKEIAEDCISKLNEDSKQLIKTEYKTAEEFAKSQHFLYGLQIRNEYIHGKDIQSGIHPDDLSNEILKQIYNLL